MRHAQLPRYLRHKMRTYYQLRFPGHRAFDEDHILSELSAPLTHEVRLQKCRNVLTALNILEAEDPQVAYYLCDKLARVVYVSGDYVIREGQEAVGMFFISAGLVEVVSKRTGDQPLTTLGGHSFFGEMALLNPTGEATASVVVRTYLDGYLLTKADYLWLETHHPVFREYLLTAAKLRMKKLMSKSSQRYSEGTHGSADLGPLHELLDPVKRRLQNKVAGGAKKRVDIMTSPRVGPAAAEGAGSADGADGDTEYSRLKALPDGAITDPAFAPPEAHAKLRKATEEVGGSHEAAPRSAPAAALEPGLQVV